MAARVDMAKTQLLLLLASTAASARVLRGFVGLGTAAGKDCVPTGQANPKRTLW